MGYNIAEADALGGAAVLFYGRALLDNPLDPDGPDVTLTGPSGSHMAYTALGGLDLSADGWPELLLGAPSWEEDGEPEGAGALYILDPTTGW